MKCDNEPAKCSEGRADTANSKGILHKMDAGDQRQYMLNGRYEIYEKQGVPLGAMAFHYHNFYELIHILEGDYAVMLRGKTFQMKKGDFLLINQNVMHKYSHVDKKHDSSKRIILWISPAQLAQLGGDDMDLSACFKNEESCAYHFPAPYEEMLQGYLRKLVLTQMTESADPGTKQALDRGYLTLFFVYFNTLCTCREYFFAQENLESHPLVEQVSVYIDEHQGERITVEVLAEHVHMSKFHFLRKFKELTGITVHAFLINKRLIQASGLLRTGMEITQIWQCCGFADYSSFLRNFKAAYGMSPSKFKTLKE